MTKTLTNFSFAVAAAIVVLIFFSSKSYPQLAFAIVLYAALVYIGLMIFPRKSKIATRFHPEPITEIRHKDTHETAQENVFSLDVDKRAFIKLVGATSVSFLLFSLLGRGIEGLLFGRNQTSGFIPAPDHKNQGSFTTDGYRISEIDESETSYFGFTNQNGGWLIMKEDTSSSSFRYAKGDEDFPKNWSNRQNLSFDYYHNLIRE